MSMIDFLIKMGANTISVKKNPQNGNFFFVVEGTEVTGRVSSKVSSEEELALDLRVSWVEVQDEPGKGSYILHKPGSGGAVTVSSFSRE